MHAASGSTTASFLFFSLLHNCGLCYSLQVLKKFPVRFQFYRMHLEYH
jgi:hypothetical protein